MAIRNVLHMSQLKAFEEFLESKGYLIIPTVGAYEVLRAQKPKKDRKPKESPVIVYRKGGAIVHLRSLQGGLMLEPVMVDGICWML